MQKRGQMKLSFGMIFSIILILIFIAFGIYVVIKFLNMQETIQLETFQNDLQEDVNKMWQSQQGSREVDYTLPKKINAICFVDNDYYNLLFETDEHLDGITINNIDIESITSDGSLCIANVEGKVSMTLVKDYGETRVKIIK